MLISSRSFFVAVILLSILKKSKSLCRRENNFVYCESVRYISKTLISQIPGINKVTVINIEFSPGLEIFPKAFQSAINLQTLNIRSNKINKLYNDCFQNISITVLILASNEISFIPPGILSNLPLKILRLENNSLEEIPTGLANSPVEVLLLFNNQIQYIENKALENLPHLKDLQLNDNKLQSIFPHRILTYPQRLRFLVLKNNRLTAITNYMLQKLTNLTALALGYNSISFIEENCFEQTPNLNYLDLSNNHLKHINENILPNGGLVNLERLLLDNNKLMYLQTKFFIQLKSLKFVSIVGNPWLCSCLSDLEIFLEAYNIMEMNFEDYVSGKNPICVNNVSNDTRCRYIYNEELSEKYQTHKH